MSEKVRMLVGITKARQLAGDRPCLETVRYWPFLVLDSLELCVKQPPEGGLQTHVERPEWEEELWAGHLCLYSCDHFLVNGALMRALHAGR